MGLDVNINYYKYCKAFTFLHNHPERLFLLTNADSTFPTHGTLFPGRQPRLFFSSFPCCFSFILPISRCRCHRFSSYHCLGEKAWCYSRKARPKYVGGHLSRVSSHPSLDDHYPYWSFALGTAWILQSPVWSAIVWTLISISVTAVVWPLSVSSPVSPQKKSCWAILTPSRPMSTWIPSVILLLLLALLFPTKFE